MDKTFFARMQRIIGVLKIHGIRREKRMFSAFTERNDNGKTGFRKWNEGGREWRKGIAAAFVPDLVTEARSGNRVQDCYYPNVKFTVLQSRHIKYENAKKEAVIHTGSRLLCYSVIPCGTASKSVPGAI